MLACRLQRNQASPKSRSSNRPAWAGLAATVIRENNDMRERIDNCVPWPVSPVMGRATRARYGHRQGTEVKAET
jgi:hypothetical protein